MTDAPIDLPAVIQSLRVEIARLTKQNTMLTDVLAAITEQHRRVMAEQCAPDERHCTCVPVLRAEIERLRATAACGD